MNGISLCVETWIALLDEKRGEEQNGEEGEIGSKSREEGEIGSECREKGDLLPCSYPLRKASRRQENQIISLALFWREKQGRQ